MALDLHRFYLGFLLFYILFMVNTSFGSFQGRSTQDLNKIEICRMDSCFDGGNITSFCKVNQTTIGRCCVSNRTGTVVGLDLTNCTLKTMPSLQSVKISLNWLYLQDNPDLECNTTVFHSSFKGLANLTELVLPGKCNCTGGDNLWKQHNISGSERWCEGQKNSCKVLNVTCPANSACYSNGPGFSQCLCESGWFGYKCLVTHGFPWVVIMASVGGSTVFLIIVILLIQRKRKSQVSSHYTIVQ